MKLRNALIGAGALGVLFGVPRVRREVLSKGVMTGMNKLGFLPTISETEKTAIEAGDVWVDGELFSGRPDFERLLNEQYPDLNEEERAFLEGPVEELCKMVTDWEIWQERGLPDEAWDFIKEHRFFGLIIPKEFGGHGFGPSANSAVVTKLAAHSQVLSITVMVPNSLGPAELLIHYGTREQQEYYLPRLATAEEIPAFALTEPQAGSDAGAISASGEVYKDKKGNLRLRLNWNKRYITLAPISTVLGLAFKLRDPENLLGKGTDLGITCALIPTDTKGVEIGRRHDPLGVPFYNAPTEGHDVDVPIDTIIGGIEGSGNGWRMLMESLAAGRGISLPASAVGGTKFVYRVAGAHAAVRRQFGVSIGMFEGIEEPLARIGGFTYIMEAARRYTNGGLDAGAKPAVVSAIMKYNTTEMGRQVINDGMDILAGNAISRGPRNTLAHGYIGTPIAITVEGANILTRTLMIFGQGAIRCHPYAFKEIEALQQGDLEAFDRAFWGHVTHVLRNTVRTKGLFLTRGALARSPVDGPARPYYKKLAWASAQFAILADLALGGYGGALKRRGKLTGRFADIFSWLYLANATLVRFEKEGRLEEDLPFFEWAMEYAFMRMQEGFEGLFENLDLPVLGVLFRGPVAAWARLNPLGTGPSDELGHRVAQAMQVPGPQRDRHTSDIYVSEDTSDALGRLEHALRLHHEVQPVEKKLRTAVREKRIKRSAPARMVEQALKLGIIAEDEAKLLEKAEAARIDAIQVDAFDLDKYHEIYAGKAAVMPTPISTEGNGAAAEPEITE